MHPLSIMIKPSSSNCNMRCRYCFYFDETDNRQVKSYGFISSQTTENLIKKALEFATIQCSFMFQGGEPTLIGIEYFKNFVKLVEQMNTKKLNIIYSIQTNGYTIDDEFAKFLFENNFLVGVSLDGIKDINDLNRLNIQSKSTYNKVMHTINLLQKHKVEFNILSVVTKQSSKNIKKTYNFFKKNKLLWHQYIPCLDPINNTRGSKEYSLKPEDYANFLKRLFDIWYLDIKNGENISIRYFDDILNMLLNGQANSCTIQGQCSYYYAIEADGEIYPCDFYMLDEYKLGNINSVSFSDIDKKREYLKFIENSCIYNEDCKLCKWFKLCGGGCMRDRQNFKTGEIGKTYLCESFKDFFEYSYDRFIEISKIIATR